MAASKHEVFDSDDDDDGISPLSSPLASPQLSPLPLPLDTETIRAETETASATEATHLADTSTSTDPSFFRDVYEEQQRAIGAQLGVPLYAPLDESQDVLAESISVVNTGSRDPWEVPSSPIEVAGQQMGSYLKRKREQQQQESQESLAQAKTKKQRTADAAGSSNENTRTPAHEIISIPLEPLTPSRMHQYPRLLSSSINDELGATNDEALPRPHQEAYNPILPNANDGVTQSTVAFTTPSAYNSSGRRVLGSSNNTNSNSILKQLKSSHDMDVVQEEDDIVVVGTSTPAKQIRKVADMTQMMSSPDIIAEPTSRESPQHQSPLPQDDILSEEDEEGGVEWDGHKPTNSQPPSQPRQPRSSVGDELSISIEVPVRDSAVREIYESDASYDSPKEKRQPRAKKKTPKKKPVLIAASDEEDDEGVDHIVALPPAESESDFSDGPFKGKGKKATATAKRKRGPKKKAEILSVELSIESAPSKATTAAKRPRGRPKRQKTPLQDGESDEDVLVQGIIEDDEHYKSDQYENTTILGVAPDSEADSEADFDEPSPVKPKAKGKKGKQAAKESKKESKRGRKPTKAKAEDIPAIPVCDDDGAIDDEKVVLGDTSGNASASNSFKNEEPEIKVEKTDTKKDVKAVASTTNEKPGPLDIKPATNIAPERAGLSTGLVTTASQGRVPYRVGLSKKSRIAPLLKMIRK